MCILSAALLVKLYTCPVVAECSISLFDTDFVKGSKVRSRQDAERADDENQAQVSSSDQVYFPTHGDCHDLFVTLLHHQLLARNNHDSESFPYGNHERPPLLSLYGIIYSLPTM